MKKAFTLVEIIIAIFIFSIIMVYLYDVIAVAKKSTTAYEKMYKKDEESQRVKRLFYNDIFNQTDPYLDTSVKIKDNFTTYFLRTNNSLYDNISPFVAYRVINNDLYRFESPKKFTLPLSQEDENRVQFDKIISNLDSFLIYKYKNSSLISYKKNNSQTIFEIALPYSKKVVVVKGGK